MNKPANRCGCTHTHTHTHTHTVYSYQREELAEVAKVCLLYSKTAYDFVCNIACEIVYKAEKNTYYKYKKIGVV